ncbi:MAG: radical SAM family heme chaperone HemW [Pirellulaceae bacterium]|nr:radical SAM family heme chaperone HemW [Pirellulaceae bacterium]
MQVPEERLGTIAPPSVARLSSIGSSGEAPERLGTIAPPGKAEPRAVYVHVPFCRHRCGYCNFTVLAGRDDLAPAYLEAVEREMSWLGQPRPVDTLFVGGGTPTHLEPAQLARLLDRTSHWFPPTGRYEWSVEANPGDLRAEILDTLAAAGVTRLSLGVQSFDDRKLRTLERDHRAEQVLRVLDAARPRFESLSLDLIFAVPGESLDDWQRDLRMAVAAPIDHVSCYGLTFERGTRFWGRRLRGQLAPLAEELELKMYELAIDTLESAEFEHYEVSNFARPGHRCRHNEVYWRGEPYFAVGPGAARYVGGRREVNHRSTTNWLQRVRAGQSPVAESEQLAPEPSARERMVLGLRMRAGVDRDDFQRRTGYELDRLLGEQLPLLVDWGLLADDGRRIRLTRRGLVVSDTIWPRLL